MGEKLTERQKDMRVAIRKGETGVLQLCDAARGLRLLGHEQIARALDNASFEAAQAIAQACSDEGKLAALTPKDPDHG